MKKENIKRGMSEELRQNARQTMGELRDLMRETGLSWAFIEHEIELAAYTPTGIRHALDSIDPYTTGLGRRLDGLPRNL